MALQLSLVSGRCAFYCWRGSRSAESGSGRSMRRAIKIFFGSAGTNPYLVLLCLVLSSFAEAVGIGTLLPAIAAIAGDSGKEPSQFALSIRSTIESAGVEPSLGNLVLIVIAFMLCRAVLVFAALSYAGVAAARVSIDVRRRLITALFDARWGFFAEQRGGKFANTISNDAGRSGEAYWQSAMVMARVIQVVGYAVMAILINWRLAIFGFIGGMIVGLALGRIIRITRQAGYKQTDRTSELSVYMVDMLTNIKPLKTMQRHQPMLASITVILNKLKRALTTRELSKAGLTQASDFLTATLAGGGAYFAYTRLDTSLPEMVVSGVIFIQILNVMSGVQKLLQNAVVLESAYVRTQELIDEAEANRETNPGRLPPPERVSCRFENVTFAHGESAVVTNVSFEVPSAAITVLNGPSGSGKTTLIDLLVGLNRPDQGRIMIGDVPLTDIDLWAWRHRIGYVPQELSLFHDTIRTNITLGDTTIADSDVLAALAQAGAGDFLAQLPHGLDTDVGEMGGKLSGGQRQRISLARALVIKPALLILDEVTSALDPRTEAEIVANIAGLRGKYTIVAITHRQAWTEIADRLYKVSHGKVTAEEAGKRRAAKPRTRQGKVKK